MQQPTQNDDDPLLQIIPFQRLTSSQRNLRPLGASVYTFLREPRPFEDWDAHRGSAIWLANNGTMLVLNASSMFRRRTLSFQMAMRDTTQNDDKEDDEHERYYYDGDSKNEQDEPNEPELCGGIFGETDAAIAETATWFLSLMSKYKYLEMYASQRTEPTYRFDFGAALSADQLARILEANPQRQYRLETGTWTAEQSVILATRSHSLSLKLGGLFAFVDEGTAFVDALEKRHSPFGSLELDFDIMPFSKVNLKRLFQLNYAFQMLKLRSLDEDCVLWPLSAKVHALDYQIRARYMQAEHLESIYIVVKDTTLKLYDTVVCESWVDDAVAFLNRVSELGHFERLGFSIDFRFDREYIEQFDEHGELTFDTVAPIADALIRALDANPSLTYLDLSKHHWLLNWCPHMQAVFKALERHERMRTLILREYPKAVYKPYGDSDEEADEDSDDEDPAKYYSWLEELLMRNENITVLNKYGKRCFNDGSIREIYLNRYYRASAKLAKETLRTQLVTTALVHSASRNFQRTAMVLSTHIDMLCELVEHLKLDEDVVAVAAAAAQEVEVVEEPTVTASTSQGSGQSDVPKRKATTEPSYDARKAARNAS